MSSKLVISPWRRLIDTSKVMSIAVGSNETAWSAPVYYLFDDKKFYFFSNPESRHIKLSKNSLAAASIFRDDADMKKLAGIQMSGTIFKFPLNARSVRVAKKYCAHFKISGNTMDILDFFASKFHASLYCFEPETIYFMDNSKGFGSREKVAL
jgi:uncharacterized protein YhbP (UPF0306 family)